VSPDPSGGGDVAAKPERLKQLGADLEKQVGPYFDAVKADVQEARGTSHSLYTSTCYPFAVAYTEAVEYMEEAMKTKHEQLVSIHARLGSNAQGWAMAEDKSTITT
jgi:hypothetical protein